MMKRTIFFLFMFLSVCVFSQTKRNGISYQAMILNPNSIELPGIDYQNAPMVNKPICLKFEIYDEYNHLEFAENMQVTTDSYGMVNVVIGTGQPLSFNQFSDIEWTANSKILKVYVDVLASCMSYDLISSQELTAVPFALYSPASDIPGPQGDSAYKVWLDSGKEGNEQVFLESLIGPDGLDGKSAYDIWLENENEGTEAEFLESLVGNDGALGQSAYQLWLLLGNEGTEQDFINSLKGTNGENGKDALLDLPNGNEDGDILQWVWNTDRWIYVIVKPDDTGIVLTSSAATRNQTICELNPIDTITYAFTGTVSNVVVSGLPNGVNYQLNNSILSISGSPTIDVSTQTTFQYIVSVSNGTKTLNASGNIIINPQASITLKSGDLTQSSCLNQAISPVIFSIDNPSPNATATGLPSGVTAVVAGNEVTIQGTPSSAITNGSVFNYVITTQSTSCELAQITGSLSFADCTSCIPTGGAGSDATICNGQSYTLMGSASNYTHLLWSSSGTGSFNNAATINPIYTPSVADYNSGGATLSLTISNTSCTTSQTLQDSMYLTITNCSSITLELQNNPEAYLFAYDLKFGATVVVDNMQKVANVGLCYNTTGGPTVSDSKVSQNYTNSGFWINSPHKFELTLSGVPVSKLYVRAFATSIGGDVFYGDQIEVTNYDPNRNQIYNFTEVSGNFSPNNYTIETTSDIHFVNITTLSNINWDFGTSVPHYSNIVGANFPNLTTVTGNIIVSNEKSLRAFNAPKLKIVKKYLEFDYTSLESIYLPELESISEYAGDYNYIYQPDYDRPNFISNNPSLVTINLNKLKNYFSTFYIFNNPKINQLKFPALGSSSIPTSNQIHSLRIYSNNLLEKLVFSGTSTLTARIYIYSNPALTSVEFPDLVNGENSSFFIYNNSQLSSLQLTNTTALREIQVYDNFELSTFNLPNITTVHSLYNITNNDNLTSLSAPKLAITGTTQYLGNSFKIDGNALLSDLDFSGLEKVYGNLTVTSNPQLNMNEFICPFFIYENDGFDCSFGTISVSGNLNNTYCFQDESLLDPRVITTTAVSWISSVQAVSGGTITAPSKMISRGCVWSTTQTPTLADNVNYSENGNLNGTFTSYMYNLTPGTTYYVRSYGTDCDGTYYGDTKSFTTSL